MLALQKLLQGSMLMMPLEWQSALGLVLLYIFKIINPNKKEAALA